MVLPEGHLLILLLIPPTQPAHLFPNSSELQWEHIHWTLWRNHQPQLSQFVSWELPLWLPCGPGARIPRDPDHQRQGLWRRASRLRRKLPWHFTSKWWVGDREAARMFCWGLLPTPVSNTTQPRAQGNVIYPMNYPVADALIPKWWEVPRASQSCLISFGYEREDWRITTSLQYLLSLHSNLQAEHNLGISASDLFLIRPVQKLPHSRYTGPIITSFV